MVSPLTVASDRCRRGCKYHHALIALALFLAAVSPAMAQTPRYDDRPENLETQNRRLTDDTRSPLRGVLSDSLRLLLLEHAFRLASQPGTRQELRGPFLNDYLHSLGWPTTWQDGDGFLVNYIGHPIHGAAAGRIWLQHDPHAHDGGLSTRQYWTSRAKAVRWIALYSVQFEFGPISEASLGNVGLDRARTGWVDHVMTPLGALGVMIAEDAIDKHIVRWIEARTTNGLIRAASRMALNPSLTMANLAGRRAPWHRAGRPLRQR